MTSMRALLEARASKRDQMETIHKAHPDGTLPADAQKQWDSLKGDLDSIEQRISRQSTLDDTERRISGTPLAGPGSDNRWQELLQDYSLSKACLNGDSSVDSAREREVSQEIATRTGRKPRGLYVPREIFMAPVETRAGQIIGDATLGGELSPQRYRGDLYIDRLRSALVLTRLGVTSIGEITTNTVIPRLTGSGTVQWISENQEPTESTATFGSITLNPRTAACAMSYSRRTLLSATPSIDALLRDDISRQIANAVDVAALTGSGAAGQPRGLFNTTGLNVVSLGAAGAIPTVDQLIDLSASIDLVDANVGGAAWLTTPKAVGAIQKLKDGSGRYYFLDTLPGSLLGSPLVRSTAVPSNLVKGGSGAICSAVIYAAWSSMILALGSLDVLPDPYTRGSTGAVRLYAFQDCDVAVRHVESFSVFLDAKTS